MRGRWGQATGKTSLERWRQTSSEIPPEHGTVFALGAVPGWVVTRQFVSGFDILTYVSPTELADADPPADAVRQVGCQK